MRNGGKAERVSVRRAGIWDHSGVQTVRRLSEHQLHVHLRALPAEVHAFTCSDRTQHATNPVGRIGTRGCPCDFQEGWNRQPWRTKAAGRSVTGGGRCPSQQPQACLGPAQPLTRAPWPRGRQALGARAAPPRSASASGTSHSSAVHIRHTCPV